ncbi:hypothetical protein [Companilactobacillus alimentarius]|uniref:Uncharacterized protein n=1 Tax=Companilactobacillus alimentarius DSM 20249 TaxID=1423720 RepID=A0A2K9HN05_9LACO|nr:hypothetical protein [Companilactobacillus alimentarius]AUI72635.1 hypothetical protein LA20249_10750 [Companilactobacillus alimentarius DSM 20249]MDT6952201.1 hypothetical protein [Companilactobacillus alimentarius]GEO45645.1 hypothetical protein LAL01_18770 [Companilactobacillus alimentarius]
MIRRFGRKINYVPLLITLIIGVGIGIVCFLISRNILIGIMFGLLSIIIASSIISINIQKYFGYWEISKDGIQYCEYDSFGKRISAIFFPHFVKNISININNINSISLKKNKGLSDPKGIGPNGAIDSSYYIVGSALNDFTDKYFFNVALTNGKNIDLSAFDDTNDINKIVSDISNIIGKEVFVKSTRLGQKPRTRNKL